MCISYYYNRSFFLCCMYLNYKPKNKFPRRVNVLVYVYTKSRLKKFGENWSMKIQRPKWGLTGQEGEGNIFHWWFPLVLTKIQSVYPFYYRKETFPFKISHHSLGKKSFIHQSYVSFFSLVRETINPSHTRKKRYTHSTSTKLYT